VAGGDDGDDGDLDATITVAGADEHFLILLRHICRYR